MPPKQYPIADQLAKNPSIHCASLVVTENFQKTPNGGLAFAQPSHDQRNGTLTFVKKGDKVYGITCWHVIEHFRGQLAFSGNPSSHSMQTMVGGFYTVLDRFIRPQSQLGDPPLDIAIREVNKEFPVAIGKTPIDLDSGVSSPEKVEHGYAVGFPESLKYRIDEDNFCYRVSMPQVQILAELEGMPNRRFTLFSELENRPNNADYSGMSGGPIFWSTDESYGIFGIVYEGGLGNETAAGRAIYVYGELATPETICDWIRQVPSV